MTILVASLLVLNSAPFQGAVQSPQKWRVELRPGVIYTQEMDPAAPLIIHTLRFRYPAAGLRMESRLAKDMVFSRDKSLSRETVSEMATRTGSFAAINADFFGWDGDPLGIQVSNSEIVSEPYVPRAAMAWTESAVLFDSPRWQGTLVLDSVNINLNGVDRSARKGEIILNTSRAGVASSKEACYAFVFEVREPLAIGKNISARIKNVFPDIYDMPVGESEIVVMATKARAQEILPNVKMNQSYTFRIDVTGQINWKVMKEAIGGGPRLLKDGKVYISNLYEKFDLDMTKRHPRTAVGITSNGEIVWTVVDGRSPISRGATFEELAAIMLKQGCTDAMNLDGGGSSTMVLSGAIVNRPSDGVARPVANGLLLYLDEEPTAQQGLRITPPSRAMKVGSNVTFRITDTDGAPIPPGRVLWTGSSAAGWIDAGGTIHALAPGKVKIQAVSSAGGASAEIEITK